MKLLNCPFCGGNASFEREGTPRRSCIVSCDSCGVRHESSDEGARSGTQWNERVQNCEAKYNALKAIVLDNVDCYADKVIHVFTGPDFQSWVSEIHIPDPLPETWDRHDTQKPRLTAEQALDRYVDLMVKHRSGS